MPDPRRLLLTPEALADIDRLDVFLRSVSNVAADKLQDQFIAAFAAIAEHPFAGRPWVRCPPGRDIRERLVPFGRRGYIARYEITGSDIVIARLHHGLEDREPR